MTRAVLSPVTIAVAAGCMLVEAFLLAGDFGLIEISRLRYRAYEYGGFWPGLLQDWRPNYPGQPALMFLTYSFLHSGVVHLVVNMLTLFSLGSAVAGRVGHLRYAAVYAVSILGGAVGFALLTSELRPMVGASGALFGLAGAVTAWEYIDRRDLGETIVPVIRIVVILALLNLVLWWAMNGLLAWETHLGGFLAGAGAAFVMRGQPDL